MTAPSTDLADEIEAMLRRHEFEKWHLCTNCGSQFDTREEFTHHLKSHDSLSGKECTITRATIRTRSPQDESVIVSKKLILIAHDWKMRRNSVTQSESRRESSKSYSCGDCGKVYTKRLQLAIHDFCHRRFGKGCQDIQDPPPTRSQPAAPPLSQGILSRGTARAASSTARKRFTCEACGKDFASRAYCDHEHRAHCKGRLEIERIENPKSLRFLPSENEWIFEDVHDEGHSPGLEKSGVSNERASGGVLISESFCTCVVCNPLRLPPNKFRVRENPSSGGRIDAGDGRTWWVRAAVRQYAVRGLGKRKRSPDTSSKGVFQL